MAISSIERMQILGLSSSFILLVVLLLIILFWTNPRITRIDNNVASLKSTAADSRADARATRETLAAMSEKLDIVFTQIATPSQKAEIEADDDDDAAAEGGDGSAGGDGAAAAGAAAENNCDDILEGF